MASNTKTATKEENSEKINGKEVVTSNLLNVVGQIFKEKVKKQMSQNTLQRVLKTIFAILKSRNCFNHCFKSNVKENRTSEKNKNCENIFPTDL